METKTITHETPDGEEITTEVPAHWVICSHCRGNGKTSVDNIGAITSDEWHRDWSFDEQESYIRGEYDVQCSRCNGTGKRLFIDREATLTEEQQAAIAWHDECLRLDAQDRQYSRMERMMGA